MNPDIFKIYSVKWDSKDSAKEVVLEHIETGKRTTLRTQQATIEEIEKELKEGYWPIFVKKDIGSLITMDTAIKIRRQMRTEIITFLDKLKKEK